MNTTEKPHAEDMRTLEQIRQIAMGSGDWEGCLADAYHLGRIRGSLEGAQQAIGFVQSKQ